MAFIIGYAKEKFNSNFITSISMILGLSDSLYSRYYYVLIYYRKYNTPKFNLLCSSIYRSRYIKLILAYIIGETVCKRVFSSLNIAK